MILMMIAVGCNDYDGDDFDDGSCRMYVYTNGYVYTMTRIFDDNAFLICCIMFHRSLLPSVPVIGAVPV